MEGMSSSGGLEIGISCFTGPHFGTRGQKHTHTHTHTHTQTATPANHCPSIASAHMATTQIAFFTHTLHNKANSIHFAHQSLCSPRISTLLKAIRHGYLKGCPNLTKNGVTKYLNPSPASSKGHMKRPCHGIRSTGGGTAPTNPNIIPAAHAPSLQGFDMSHASNQSNLQPTNVIESNKETAANVFCFAAFADNHTGVLYSNLTGMFPFMSLEGNVCFLVVYHYETNAILALPIKTSPTNVSWLHTNSNSSSYNQKDTR